MAADERQMSARDFPDRFSVRAPRGDVVMTFEREGDRLLACEFVVRWEPGRPLDELGTSDMTAFATALVEYWAAGQVIERAGESLGLGDFYMFLDSDEHAAAARQARAVARQLARPRRRGAKIEDGFLKEVVDHVREHGTARTWDHYDVDQRTLRRWLSLAGDRGLYPEHRSSRS